MIQSARNVAVLALTVLVVSGCAISPNEIFSTSSKTLCDVYAAPLAPNYLDPAIKSELQKRGHAGCTDPALIAARQASSMQMFMMGSQLMQAGQPRLLAPPVAAPSMLPRTQNCVSRVQGNQLITSCN